MSITKVSDLKIENVFVSDIKKNKAGGEAAYLKYDGNNIILQTDILNVISNQDNTVEFNCENTTFLKLIIYFESLAEKAFGKEENSCTLRSTVSDNNSIKLIIIDGITKMFDSKKNSTDLLDNETKVQILVQPTGIWNKNQEYGVSFRLLQVKVLEKEETLEDYAFVDDENDYYDVVPNDF